MTATTSSSNPVENVGTTFPFFDKGKVLCEKCAANGSTYESCATPSPVTRLPRFEKDGYEVCQFELNRAEFYELQQRTYESLSPARNATNKLQRGLAWGMGFGSEIIWTDDNAYSLPTDLNPEEGGRIRYFDPLSDEFKNHVVVRSLIESVWSNFHSREDRARYGYLIQLSAIRYAPTIVKTAKPSPDMPHQDKFNNGIAVLAKTENLRGGETRVFDVKKDELLFETNLEPGELVLVEDSRFRHQVLPMTLDTTIDAYGPCHRDILIVRIDRVKR